MQGDDYFKPKNPEWKNWFNNKKNSEGKPTPVEVPFKKKHIENQKVAPKTPTVVTKKQAPVKDYVANFYDRLTVEDVKFLCAHRIMPYSMDTENVKLFS